MVFMPIPSLNSPRLNRDVWESLSHQDPLVSALPSFLSGQPPIPPSCHQILTNVSQVGVLSLLPRPSSTLGPWICGLLPRLSQVSLSLYPMLTPPPGGCMARLQGLWPCHPAVRFYCPATSGSNRSLPQLAMDHFCNMQGLSKNFTQSVLSSLARIILALLPTALPSHLSCLLMENLAELGSHHSLWVHCVCSCSSLPRVSFPFPCLTYAPHPWRVR